MSVPCREMPLGEFSLGNGLHSKLCTFYWVMHYPDKYS